MIKVRSSSLNDTKLVADALAGVLVSGDVVLLIGDMGSGKTTFVQGLGSSLGVDEPITSPTFVLLHTYQGRLRVHHADLYRLDQLSEVLDLGIMELIDDGGIALIEWADRGQSAFPPDAVQIRFSYDEDEGSRLLEFHFGAREETLQQALQDWVVAS